MKQNILASQFHTRQSANEGIDLPLYLPDGTATEHSIKIRGVDSEVFRRAEIESRRRAMEAAATKGKEGVGPSEQLEERLFLIASLVISWSFEQECTVENVKTFLREAPQVADQIDSLAAKRSLFFKKGSTNSQPLPALSSS
jgi:hypothetical protein